MKLWAKNEGAPLSDLSQRIEQFTTGDDLAFDLLLAPFDVQGSMAHTQMLVHTGLLAAAEGQQIVAALEEIAAAVAAGTFQIEPGVEDVHSQVELLLTRRLGDTGKKVHTARSRNDQVLLDLKLWMRDALAALTRQTVELGRVLLSCSERHKNVLLPGYTHLQVAMPSSFGLWFGAYAEALAEDLFVVEAAWRTANQCPLGSAAGYGSSLPIDRVLTARLLGFEDLNWNVVYAQMTRGKAEKTAGYALAQVAATLGRLCMDITLYMSQNFGFLSLPAALTTGSSIMPHKKNPDAFELIRAWCNEIQGLPGTVQHVLGNLPSGYHRDLQILKGQLMPAFQRLTACLEMAIDLIPALLVREHISSDPQYRDLFSVEVVNRLVAQGVPFRDAYKQVGRDIAAGRFHFSEADQLPDTADALAHTHAGSLGYLCNAEIAGKLDRAAQAILKTPPQRAF